MRKTWKKEAFMGRIRFSPEQIIDKLREVEPLLDQGMNIGYYIR